MLCISWSTFSASFPGPAIAGPAQPSSPSGCPPSPLFSSLQTAGMLTWNTAHPSSLQIAGMLPETQPTHLLLHKQLEHWPETQTPSSSQTAGMLTWNTAPPPPPPPFFLTNSWNTDLKHSLPIFFTSSWNAHSPFSSSWQIAGMLTYDTNVDLWHISMCWGRAKSKMLTCDTAQCADGELSIRCWPVTQPSVLRKS